MEPLGEPSLERFRGRFQEWIQVWMLVRRTEPRLKQSPESECRFRRHTGKAQDAVGQLDGINPEVSDGRPDQASGSMENQGDP